MDGEDCYWRKWRQNGAILILLQGEKFSAIMSRHGQPDYRTPDTETAEASALLPVDKRPAGAAAELGATAPRENHSRHRS